MKPFGLTGNIGCGKSTVARFLAKLSNVIIFDTDDIAKEVIASDINRLDILDILGVDVFSFGSADFGAIAKIVFSDHLKKKQLERFVHPLVWKLIQDKITLLGDQFIYIVESAIIYEIGLEDRFSAVIVATCSPEEQLRRLKENRKMGDSEIKGRLLNQFSLADKEKRADLLIYTDCDLVELQNRVNKLYYKLMEQKKGEE